MLYEVITVDLGQLSQTWLEMSKNPIDNPTIFVIGLLFLVAAMMKSAIVPFHIWLPYTSEAPTPVSALMHAGVVNVGGILLNKLAFVITSYSIHYTKLYDDRVLCSMIKSFIIFCQSNDLIHFVDTLKYFFMYNTLLGLIDHIVIKYHFTGECVLVITSYSIHYTKLYEDLMTH